MTDSYYKNLGELRDLYRDCVEIERKIAENAILVLPLASLIETGNHIAHAADRRYQTANSFAQLIRAAAVGNEPWAPFTGQDPCWTEEALVELADNWPNLAAAEQSIGDYTIKEVAEHYASTGCSVEILTGDDGLRAYTPTSEVLVPRRRR